MLPWLDIGFEGSRIDARTEAEIKEWADSGFDYKVEPGPNGHRILVPVKRAAQSA